MIRSFARSPFGLPRRPLLARSARSSILLVGALATGFTPSLLHANQSRVVPAAPAPRVTPLAAMSANAAMRGVMSVFGEVGELAMRDLAARKLDLQDFRGGRDTVVISTSTLIIILLVILILVIVL